MKVTAAAAVEVELIFDDEPAEGLAEKVYEVRRRALEAIRQEFIDGHTEVVVRLLHSADLPEMWVATADA